MRFAALLFFAAMAISDRGQAQTLSRGDIAIIEWSSLTSERYFSFVCWKDIEPGTHIKFTSNAFRSTGSANATNNARANTSIDDWWNSEASSIPAGTVIKLTGLSSTSLTTNRGSATWLFNANGGFSNSPVTLVQNGRCLFAYQSSGADYNSSDTMTTFNGTILFGLQYRGTSGTQGDVNWMTTAYATNFKSFLPSELGASTTYNLDGFALANMGQYTGARSGQTTMAAYQGLVTNKAFWTTSSSTTAGTQTSNTAAFTITPPLSATISGTNVLCNAGSTGSATVAPTGGTAPYTYSWSPSGGSSATASGLAANTYTCTITDAASTSITKTITITQPTTLVLNPFSQTNVACNGQNTGQATVLAATGGTPSYTYSWSNGATGVTATGLSAGGYTCTVTDANGCTKTRSFTVTQPTAINGSTIVTNVACNGGTTGSIDLTPSGGQPGYTYSWTPGGQTTQDRTSLAAGAYSVVITDANACTKQITATVTQPTAINGSTVVTNVACNGGNTGSIDLTPSGGTPGYTYVWTGGATSQDRTGLTAGSYSVTITDANSCTKAVTSIIVTQPTALGGSTVVTNVACNGGNTGAINLTPSGGTPGYTYSWNPGGQATQDRSSLTAGTYSVTITDANACTGTVTATVTQPSTPVSGTTVVTNVACNGGNTGAINLTPTGGVGPYTFSWNGGQTTEDRTGLTAGTYTVTITDANACTGTVTATVTQPSTPVNGTTVVTNVACFGGNTGAINLTPTGGVGPYTFNWLPTGPTSEDRTGLVAGTYTVQITDANGCTGTVNTTVTQPTAPVSGTTVVTNVACFGGNTGAINLTPTGGVGPYTFNWLPTGPTSEDRTGLVAGTYSVQITDANGCTGTVNVTVTQPTAPVSGTTVVTNAACLGGANGSINLTPTGGVSPYTFVWAPGGATSEDRTGLVSGTYTVTITDANGCDGIVTATITSPSTGLSVSLSGTTNVSCYDGVNGTATVSASGGTSPYSYSWAPSGGTSATGTGLSAGNYTCTVTDVNGCLGTQEATITQPATPVSSSISSLTNVACFGGNDGAATISASGGTGSLSYSWSNGNTTTSVSSLTAASYTCTVTDANSCESKQTVVITQPTAITSSVSSQSNVSCNGGNNGAATVTVSGGTPGYTYSWAPSGGTAATATGLAAGTYTCTITDANGCTKDQTVTVTQPSVLVASVSSQTNVSCRSGSNGAATVSVSGGTASYTYSWSPSGGTSATASGLAAGTFTCTVTDANGCTASTDVTITQPATAVSITSISNNGPICEGFTLNLTSAALGGTGAISYEWSGPNSFSSTAQNPSVSEATTEASGVYSLTATDENGCTAMSTTAATVNPTPNAGAIEGANEVCAGSMVTLTNEVTGGTWVSSNTSTATIGLTSGIVTGASAGAITISYIVTSGAGCTNMTTTAMTVNPTPAVITGASGVCEGAAITLSTASTGGSWSSSNTTAATINTSGVVSALEAGVTTISYTYPVTGCKRTKNVTVNPMPTAIFGSTPMCTVASITLSNGVSGGAWSSANSSVASVNSSTGVVTATGEGITNVTYTLPAGCYTTTTVNSMVAPIVVTSGICIGTNALYSNATEGGTWSSSDTSILTIVDTTGAAYGVRAGNATITYYVAATGCFRTLNVVVDSVPAPIVGPTEICVGSSYLYTDASPGGAWTGLSTGVIDGPSSSGSVTGMIMGTSTITYALSSQCKTYFTITVNPVPVGINGVKKACQGQTTTLSCATAGGTWSSTNTGIATINSSGVVTGVSGGTVIISYTLSTGCASTALVTINANPATISGTTTLCQGTTTTLSSATTPGVSWISNNISVATVNSGTGVVSGVSAGTAIITYTIGTSCYTTAMVSVNPIPSAITGPTSLCSGATITLINPDAGGTWSSNTPVVGTIGSTTGIFNGLSAGVATVVYNLNGCTKSRTVTVNPTPTATSSAVMCAGSTAFVTVTPSGGAWTSSNPSVATITAPHVNGIGAGNATLTYAFTSGCFTTVPVTVNASPAAITGTANIGVGATSTLANTVAGGTWSSTNGTVATIGTSGIVTALSAGTTTISYVLSGGCFATKVFTVGALPTINGNLTICEGATTTLTIGSTGGSWISSNTGVATIGSANGVVSAISEGTATITYMLSSGAYQVATFTVLEALPAITSASFEICSGATTTLANATSGGTWSSSQISIATVGTSGIVTGGSGAGTATITYAVSAGCKTTAVITLNQLPSVIGGTANTYVGNTTTLTNTFSGGVWTSGTPTVATVSASGVVAGVGAGTSIITYALGSCPRTVIVTVDAAPDPISGPATICVGQSVTLTHPTPGGSWTQTPMLGYVGGPGSTGVISGLAAGTGTITYTLPTGAKAYFTVTVLATPANIIGTQRVCQTLTTTLSTTTSGGAWSSGNPALASINASTGVVTGVAAGNTTISYTGANGCARTTTVTVDPTPASITGTLSIQAGTTTTLASATTPGVSWTSSTPSVATINTTSRIVTGVAVGTTTITYTVGTGCIITAVVTVTPSTAPTAISGPSSVCVGATITMGNTVSGGTWSSNNANASVDLTSGIVTGVTAGASIITYTTAPGVYVVKSVVVNANPAASGGYKIACIGLTTQLTNVSGGTWSSSDTFIAKATIAGSNSTITGIAAGNANITFRLNSTGCYNVTQVTVNAVPPAITGNSVLCVGNSLTLANAQPGGSWSSSNTTVANIGAATGIVTAGTSANMSTISYSYGANCRVTTVVTVRPVPGGISAPTTVCPGSITTISCGTPNGTWSSSNTAAATVVTGSSSNYGAVTAVATGVTTITYTTAPSCFSTKTFNVGACRGANTTSVDETVADVVMSLYPNPTSGTFTIKANEAGVLNVYSLEGREVGQYQINKGETQVTLPNELARGVYMCRFSGTEGGTVMVRLVVE